MRIGSVLIIVPALLAAGCTGGSSGPTTGRLSAVEASAGPVVPQTGTFVPFKAGATAITYDQALVPAGAGAVLLISENGNGASVRLTVAGLRPDHKYGAHLHTKPCSAQPDAAGPHYQHHADPSMPSVDPRYANPANEIWLDLTTGGDGDASAESDQPWTFDEARPPRSLVLHAESTRTAPGEAGTAGPRVACMTLAGF